MYQLHVCSRDRPITQLHRVTPDGVSRAFVEETVPDRSGVPLGVPQGNVSAETGECCSYTAAMPLPPHELVKVRVQHHLVKP